MRIYRAFCLTLFLAPVLSADFDSTAWKFEAAVRLPAELGSPQFVRLTLPGWVLANAQEGLSDLRIINGSGTEVPYLLQKAETRTFQASLPTSIINRGIDPGRFEQFVCDLGPKTEVSNEIVLYTQAQNFVRKTDIAGSTDGQKWILLRSDAYIFDQQEQGRRLHNLLVSYPDSTFRYLKVMVWFDGGPPLNPTGAEVRRQERAEFTPETVHGAIVRRSEDPQRRATDVIIETSMGKQHFEECSLGIREANFERSVTVSYKDYRGAWVDVGNGTIYRFTVGPAVDQHLAVPVHDLNQKQFRIRIWNADSPPLSVTSVALHRMPRMLIFNGSSAERYRLFFANPEGEPRYYDLGGALARLDLQKLPEASVKDMKPNPSFSPRPHEKPWTERHPALIWLALGVGVLLLGGMLFRTVRDVKGIGGSGSEPGA